MTRRFRDEFAMRYLLAAERPEQCRISILATLVIVTTFLDSTAQSVMRTFATNLSGQNPCTKIAPFGPQELGYQVAAGTGLLPPGVGGAGGSFPFP